MGSISPLAAVLFIVLIVAFVGAMIAYIGSVRTFRGHTEIAAEARKLRADIGGELFRDGDDLVISGNYKGMPTVVRFSYAENTPGMNVRMDLPSALDLVIVPRGAKDVSGRAETKTGDSLFDSRFTSRTDQPQEARMLLGIRGTIGEINKLCCSSRTYFSLSRGHAEVSELTIPSNLRQHVMEHVEAMSRLAQALRQLPGADKIRVQPIRRHKHVFGRVAIAAGVVAAVFAIMATARYSEKPLQRQSAATETQLPNMSADDVALIGNLEGERVVTESDFNGDAAAWLRAEKGTVSGKIEAKFSGADASGEAAYILIDKRGDYRAVILAKGAKAFDEHFPKIGIAARVPREVVDRIDWLGRPPETPDGDGLLLLRNPDDKASGLVIFLQGTRVVTAVPSDYQAIHLE
jgi:hypothetical protein